MESKSCNKAKPSTIQKYLIKGEQARDPQWDHGVSQRTLCTSAVCKNQGHVRCRWCEKCKEDDGEPACPQTTQVGKDDEEAEAGKSFLFCCMRMGNCLCEDMEEFVAYNKRHGLVDPRLDAQWLNENHGLFQYGDYFPTDPHGPRHF